MNIGKEERKKGKREGKEANIFFKLLNLADTMVSASHTLSPVILTTIK